MLPSECEGCELATNVWFVYNAKCKRLPNPYAQHTRVGGCHMRPRMVEVKEAIKVNPLKASKRSQKGG